jgi:trans-aconitate methyltransferase
MIYDKYALYYNLIYKDKAYKEEIKYIDNLIKKYSPETKSLLDVGCGTGKHAYFLSQKGYNAEGLDMSEIMLDFAKNSYPNMTFHHGDARKFKIDKKLYSLYKKSSIFLYCLLLSFIFLIFSFVF